MIAGAIAGPRPAPRLRPASLARYAPIALKLASSAVEIDARGRAADHGDQLNTEV